MRYLLDANVVIALLNDVASKAAKRGRRVRPGDVAISAIVAHELFYGAFKSQRADRNVALVDALRFVVSTSTGRMQGNPARYAPYWPARGRRSAPTTC